MLASFTASKHGRAEGLRLTDRCLIAAVRPSLALLSSSSPSFSVIRLRALGALDLRDTNGQELRTVLAQRRRVALLAYLALATPRGLHSRDTLLALFWPD